MGIEDLLNVLENHSAGNKYGVPFVALINLLGSIYFSLFAPKIYLVSFPSDCNLKKLCATQMAPHTIFNCIFFQNHKFGLKNLICFSLSYT